MDESLYQKLPRPAYTDVELEVDKALRAIVDVEVKNFVNLSPPTPSLFNTLPDEIILAILWRVAVNNNCHTGVLEGGLPLRPHPLHFYNDRISSHLFKARTLCRKFARLGADVFRNLAATGRFAYYRRLVLPSYMSSEEIRGATDPQISAWGNLVDAIEYRVGIEGPKDVEWFHHVCQSPRFGTTGDFDEQMVEEHEAALRLVQQRWTMATELQQYYSRWLESQKGKQFIEHLFEFLPQPKTLYWVDTNIIPERDRRLNGRFEVSFAKPGVIIAAGAWASFAALEFEKLHWSAYYAEGGLHDYQIAPLRQRALLHVTSLHLSLRFAFFGDDKTGLMISDMKGLRSFTIEAEAPHVHWSKQQVFFSAVFRHINLPVLRRITIVKGNSGLQELANMIIRHESTLKELYIIEPPEWAFHMDGSENDYLTPIQEILDNLDAFVIT